MSFFSTKREWVKVVIVNEALLNWDEFADWACLCADTFHDVMHSPLYFAHYSDPVERAQRVEIQIKTVWDNDALISFFMSQVKGVKTVNILPSDGSEPHAAAYLLARQLRGKGEPFAQDCIHWMFNMMGYNYWAEVRVLADQCSKMAGNAEKSMLR